MDIRAYLVQAIESELRRYRELKDKLCTSGKHRWMEMVHQRVRSRERLATLRAQLAKMTTN